MICRYSSVNIGVENIWVWESVDCQNDVKVSGWLGKCESANKEYAKEKNM